MAQRSGSNVEPGSAGSPVSPTGSASGTGDSGERRRDPERTRADIIDAATREFADRGYTGARVDEIAARTLTTKRMIYYYFGGKEQLYIAVLERAYTQIRAAEAQVDLEGLDPVTAVRRLAETTFEHHMSHPDFVRLVSIENIHGGEHIIGSQTLADLRVPVVESLTKVLRRGRETGVFRRDVDPLDVHMLISSFCVFQVANRHTFRALFDRDLCDPAYRTRYRGMVGDVVVDYLTTTG